jgi:hypothetical protein
MQFELANAADEPALRRILRETPFVGDVSVTLEREPCVHFGNAIEGERSQILVARPAPGQPVIGMATRTLIDSFVNGAPKRIGYLSQLRILPSYQARPRTLKGGYAAMRELHADGAAPFYVTTIIADNEPARRVLEAGLPGFPNYHYVGDMLTLLISMTGGQEALGRRAAWSGRRQRTRRAAWSGPRDQSATISAAEPQDLDAIVECLERNGARHQFSPRWTREVLLSPSRSRGLRMRDFLIARREGRIVGCLACWDQREFKQTIVRGYSTRLAIARPVSNLLAPLTGIPKLPAVGGSVSFAYLSHLAVDDDDAEVFAALVLAARRDAAARGLDHLCIGLSARNPLASVALARFGAREYRSRAYVVHWNDGVEAVRSLDERPIHLEVAIL